ncbi:MAG TPA: lytic transglycosylase domain-containing protein [Thermaerobacter sp.]
MPWFPVARRRGRRGVVVWILPRKAAVAAVRALLLLAAAAMVMLLALYVAYPLPMRELIEREAAACGLDPLLIAAVARRESGFRPGAVSERGARGLMQVMPETGAWIAREIGLRDYSSEQLFDPAVNVRLGCWYLNYLLRRFDGDVVAALAAYNSGEGTVGEWIRHGQWHPGQGAGAIPYGETRHFVRNVLRDYRLYRLLYRELPRVWPALVASARIPRPGS